MRMILYDDYLSILSYELNSAISAKQVYLSKKDTAAAFMMQGVISCIRSQMRSLEDPGCEIVLDVDLMEDKENE